MRINTVQLVNFRNYERCQIELSPGRNILLGENAQGKTNFLEAIELLASAKSYRADHDSDLIRWNEQRMFAEVAFAESGDEQTLGLELKRNPQTNKLEKTFKVNGLSQSSSKGVVGRLIVVSFQSSDLNLLRGGPKFRRDWLDSLILKLRPATHELFSNYQKNVAQRNRLLKQIFERGKVTVTDQEQLTVWDKQTAVLAARLIQMRLKVLSELLPVAEQHQSTLSRSNEQLTIRYLFKAPDAVVESFGDDEDDQAKQQDPQTGPLTAEQMAAMEEIELAKTIFKFFKERRHEEIRRKQTLVGPHRDDLVFCLNGADAVSFASQGQQRSIVLSLKLAELQMLREELRVQPVLLLDDVLAELDEFRQGLLMAAVTDDMQTLITTTHVSGFDARWLDRARVFRVMGGTMSPTELPVA